MERVLTQREIEALVGASQVVGAGNESGPPGREIEPWKLHEAGRLRKEQLHSITQLHESFARNLTHSLSAYLGSKFEVTLLSVEQLTYREFLAHLPELTYCASFHLHPADTSALLQMDLPLVFPMVDLLLGGQGAVAAPAREVSEIEELVLEGVGQAVCRELQGVLQPLELTIEFECRQAAQMSRLLPAQEKTLTLTFEVAMPGAQGRMQVVFPAVVASALLRKLSTEWVYQRRRRAAIEPESLRKHLLGSTVALELGTPVLPVRLRELLRLQPGSILPLRRRIEEPAALRMGGRDVWLARPVQSGAHLRAAQLVSRLIQPEEQEKNS